MTETILQIYLNNQFIKTAEAENIPKLKKASTELQKRLLKKKSKVISYTLVALDPQIDESDPVVLEVEKLIISKWTTFKNSVSKTKDKPINYIRAVILEALIELAKDEALRAIIWNTGRNIISRYRIPKNERTIIHDLFQKLGNEVELSSRKYWGVNDTVEVSSFEVSQLKIESVKAGSVNEENLTDELKAAAVHSGWATQAGGGENPSYPHNGNVSWSKFFAERAGKGMTEVINKALVQQSAAVSSISTSLQSELDKYFSGLTPYLEKISNKLTQGAVANNKRSELLWWKMSLYSSSMDISYRELSSLEAAITMSVDLSSFVTPIYPVSVDYFLKETLRDVIGDKVDEPIQLEEIQGQFSELNNQVKNIIQPLLNKEEGRKAFGSAMANYSVEANNEGFFLETGLEKKSKLSLGDLSAWVFQDMQALKLATIK
jgi:hypothetical protein